MSQALQAYKAALRATRVAFNGDRRVLGAARAQIRAGFDRNRQLAGNEQAKAIKEMQEVSAFLVKNVVQGEKQGDKYFLKFHDKTELGDNETIKQNNRKNMGSLAKKTG